MASNTLSGNSISLTYQSVLQLNLTANGEQSYNNVLDGLGNYSVLQLHEKNPIMVGSLIYPEYNSSDNNKFLTKNLNANKLSSMDDNLFKLSKDKILYKNKINLSPEGNGSLIFNKDNKGINISGSSKLSNQTKFYRILDDEIINDHFKGVDITYKNYTIPSQYQKILRLWITITGFNTFYMTFFENEEVKYTTQLISNSFPYCFSGIIELPNDGNTSYTKYRIQASRLKDYNYSNCSFRISQLECFI
jgi:hypothetical protein